jgi:hypothetical protein
MENQKRCFYISEWKYLDESNKKVDKISKAYGEEEKLIELSKYLNV